MIMSQFKSNAEEIRYYAKELLQDGALHTKDEIINYVKSHSDKANIFTDGMFTGAIRDLVQNNNGAYINPVRGHYQRAPQASGELVRQKLQNNIIDVLNESCKGLEKACTINIIGMSAEELVIATTVSDIIIQLKNYIEEIKSM